MEYHVALSARPDLSAASARMVAQFLQLVAPLLGRPGHVLPRPPMDRQPTGGGGSGADLRVQWPFAEPAHVAEPHRDLELDAVGCSGRGARLGGRPAHARSGSPCRRIADARRRTGNHSVHLALPAGAVGLADVASLPPCLHPPGWICGAFRSIFGFRRTLAFPPGRGAGRGTGSGATAAVPGFGGALTTRSWFCGCALVHARVGLDEFPGADGLWQRLEQGRVLPTQPGMDFLLLPRSGWIVVGIAGSLEVAPAEADVAARGCGRARPGSLHWAIRWARFAGCGIWSRS